MATDFTGFVPALPMIRIGEGGEPYLAGSRCANCGQVFPGDRMACAACARREIEPVRLGARGKLYTYTIVHRSYPGIKVPFVAAVVDLDEGGSLRGTLLEIEPAPAKLERDLPVEIVFRDTGQTDPEGKPFVSYFFVPAQGEE